MNRGASDPGRVQIPRLGSIGQCPAGTTQTLGLRTTAFLGKTASHRHKGDTQLPAPFTKLMGSTPPQLRAEILNDQGRDMSLHRATAAVSLLGIATMAATTLLQMGVVRRLPDPPIRGFGTKKVNTSHEAFGYGSPGPEAAEAVGYWAGRRIRSVD